MKIREELEKIIIKFAEDTLGRDKRKNLSVLDYGQLAVDSILNLINKREAEHIKKIEEYEQPMGFGSASGSMMKSAIISYLKDEKLK